jgi:ABC-type antimicrobial peptide transport system permease subunit
MTVTLRSGADPGALTAAAKGVVRSLDPGLPIYDVRTMAERVDQSLARRRFSMLLLGLFAGLALALAMIGIYGVMAYLVNQGTREIGIRMALGATHGDILGLVIRQGMTLSFSGVALGLSGAFIISRFIRSLLFGIEATDAVTFTVVPTLLVLTALLASFIPSRRAAKVDPMIALRYE